MRWLWMRRNRGDDGLSLIETVAALMVFALIMTGLAAGMALFAHTTALTKARNAASAMAQQIMESAKSIPVNQLVICTGGGADGQNFTYQNVAHPILVGTTPCLPYTSTRTNSGISFTVTQVVFDYQPAVVVNQQPIADRMLVVTVAWSKPTPGSYTTHTVISGDNTVPAQAVVGLRININDSTNTNLITSPDLVWDYTVTNSSGAQVAGSGTDDGTSGLISLSPGTYTCSVKPEQDAGSSYDPGDNSALTNVVIDPVQEAVTATCQVPANGVLDWGTAWNEVTDCAQSNTKALSVSITVQDGSGNNVPNATVTLIKPDLTSFGSATTDSNGVATFIPGTAPGPPPADSYTINVSKTGYQTSTGLGPICVAPSVDNSFPPVSIKVLSTCPVSKSKGSLTVTVRDEHNNLIAGAKVHLVNQDGQGSPGDVNSNPQGVAFFNNNVLGGNYTYTITKSGYTNLGPQGPICVAVSPSNVVDPGLLPTQSYIGCATGDHATWVVKAVDASNNPINGVKMTLTNANGHGGTPGAKTTDSTGTVTFTNVPTDLYLITPSVPAGYADPGTQPVVCVQNTSPAMVTQVLFTGVMTVKVSVTNSDTQPTKTYNVILKDSGGQTTTNTVTINKNKTATVTFNNMSTDVYTIDVCVNIASKNNCSPINNINTTYNFTSKGTTYQNPNPATFVDHGDSL